MKKIFCILISWLLFNWIYCLWVEYNSELQQAYNWAYENKITTMDSIEKANMKWELTRAELAKMISNYAINILWHQPNKTWDCLFNDVSSELNNKYNNWITNACQLWIMWQNVKNFRPNDWVTRAEFWTVLSRVLRWDKYEWWSTYYENHLKALKSEWIMTKINNPMNKEVRGYVMLMLMRSQEPDYIQSYNDEDFTEYDDISYVMEMLD